jgi:plastocyanin
MVQITSFLSAVALFTSVVLAIPVPDSGEPAVSAVDGGIPVTETVAAAKTAAPKETGGSNYGSSNGNQYGGMQYGSNSYSSKASNNYKTSTKVMHETSSTKMQENTKTVAATSMKAQPTYGSGSSSWNSSPYDDCVQQCMNKYAPPPAQYTPPPPSNTDGGHGSAGGVGTGATHTVIVAPTKGVLRYVPFAVNASVGDTVLYRWGAGPHTVTMGSTLEICNKSSSAGTFASGMQNAGFEFSVVVNDTKPLFVYCAVPTHCQKGMFGVVNPPMAAPGAPAALGAMMQNWVQNSSDLAALQSDTKMKTAGNEAATWGSMFDTTQFPESSHMSLAENVLLTRQTLALNPGMQAANSAIRSDGQPLSIPTILLTGQSVDPNGAGGAPIATPPVDNSPKPVPTAAPSPSASAKSNGAGSIAASSLLVAFIAMFASFLAL